MTQYRGKHLLSAYARTVIVSDVQDYAVVIGYPGKVIKLRK